MDSSPVVGAATADRNGDEASDKVTAAAVQLGAASLEESPTPAEAKAAAAAAAETDSEAAAAAAAAVDAVLTSDALVRLVLAFVDDGMTLGAAACVCRIWADAADSPALWLRIVRLRWPATACIGTLSAAELRRLYCRRRRAELAAAGGWASETRRLRVSDSLRDEYLWHLTLYASDGDGDGEAVLGASFLLSYDGGPSTFLVLDPGDDYSARTCLAPTSDLDVRTPFIGISALTQLAVAGRLRARLCVERRARRIRTTDGTATEATVLVTNMLVRGGACADDAAAAAAGYVEIGLQLQPSNDPHGDAWETAGGDWQISSARGDEPYTTAAWISPSFLYPGVYTDDEDLDGCVCFMLPRGLLRLPLTDAAAGGGEPTLWLGFDHTSQQFFGGVYSDNDLVLAALHQACWFDGGAPGAK